MSRPRKLPKYTQAFQDRHGKPRYYFRRKGYPRVALPSAPWSTEFMDAYQLAMEGKLEVGRARTKPGSISDLVSRYYGTPEYKGLSDSTKATYRGIIERFRAEHGDKRVSTLRREHVRRLINAKAEKPAAANNLLRMIRMLMKFALDLGMVREDPTFGLKGVKQRSTGFATWEEEHIAQYQAHHPKGSRAHSAFMLLLNTGQRRSDVVRMGRQHICNGMLVITQQKTGQPVAIPVNSDLQSAIDNVPNGQLTFLQTAQGKPFSAAGFTNWFRDCVREAGLPDGLSPHGLRKATCRRLAEAGCTPHQIMAISGHKTLAEVTRYTVAANKEKLAREAMATLERGKAGTKTVKLNWKV